MGSVVVMVVVMVMVKVVVVVVVGRHHHPQSLRSRKYYQWYTQRTPSRRRHNPSKARMVMQEKIANAQPHDPNMVRLPDGSWGKIQQTTSGYRIIEAVESPASLVDPVFESAVSEATQEEPRVTTLALLKKVAFTPSTLMGHAYLTSTVDPKSGKLYFVGDIGDFVNHCIRFTLKYGFGVQVAITSGLKTIGEVMQVANN